MSEKQVRPVHIAVRKVMEGAPPPCHQEEIMSCLQPHLHPLQQEEPL